jgi:hypothetical protein
MANGVDQYGAWEGDPEGSWWYVDSPDTSATDAIAAYEADASPSISQPIASDSGAGSRDSGAGSSGGGDGESSAGSSTGGGDSYAPASAESLAVIAEAAVGGTVGSTRVTTAEVAAYLRAAGLVGGDAESIIAQEAGYIASAYADPDEDWRAVADLALARYAERSFRPTASAGGTGGDLDLDENSQIDPGWVLWDADPADPKWVQQATIDAAGGYPAFITQQLTARAAVGGVPSRTYLQAAPRVVASASLLPGFKLSPTASANVTRLNTVLAEASRRVAARGPVTSSGRPVSPVRGGAPDATGEPGATTSSPLLGLAVAALGLYLSS